MSKLIKMPSKEGAIIVEVETTEGEIIPGPLVRVFTLFPFSLVSGAGSFRKDLLAGL